MNIPGYYFDEHKRKYFKITNGSTANKYHNSSIQQQQRQRDIETHHQELESQINANQGIGYKLLYMDHTLENIKLGLRRLNPSLVEYEKLCNIELKCDIYCRDFEVKLWERIVINNEIYIIVTNHFERFQLLNTQTVLQHLKQGGGFGSQPVPDNQLPDGIIINFHDDGIINETANGLNLLPSDYITISTHGNLVFYNLISESDLDNPQLYQNFVNIAMIIKRGDAFIKADKSFVIFKFLKNLTNGEIKKDLLHLFGMNLIELSTSTYEYKTMTLKPRSRFFITFSKFIDNYLILGTNLGIVYLIKYTLDEQLVFYDDIIKFKFDTTIKLDKITQIEKVDDYLFISSFKKLILVNIENSVKFSYENLELIKNFKVFKVTHLFKIVFISYKRISELVFDTRLHQFQVMSQYDVINDNLLNLFSNITNKNNIIMKQSENSLLVVNLGNLKSNVINLANQLLKVDNMLTLSEPQKINGLIRLNEQYLLINVKNRINSCQFQFYEI